ncbi:hypothetical protein WICPIJ_005840 [Wickerhamomyces pijperi]|uniref:Cyclin-dependent kinase 8 n=1 Tax=Wickerhamomyces pijperi TaxID=599730 RepID=A0A9P8TLL1_WICPI|nr:hypothetical protein WICPIJ_005840 [Wickerhamomyces pijperi]
MNRNTNNTALPLNSNTSQSQREYLLRLQQTRQSNPYPSSIPQQKPISNDNTPSRKLQQQQLPHSTGQLINNNPGANTNTTQMPIQGYGGKPAQMAGSGIFTLGPYRTRKDSTRKTILSKYDIMGYIASGTYGRVYKAKSQDSSNPMLFAIKKFKADKEGEIVHYTGISQSAAREMGLCRELSHTNVTNLIEVNLENKAIYMVFEYAEHDLLQIIHFHSHPDSKPIPESEVKSIMWQVLNGVSYLHQNWVLHRDLKPANIMVTNTGVIKIGDLGLARKFNNPLQALYSGDKVVVTIWYRAPELLLGGRHYTAAIDLWAVGCIFAELLALRPIFKGEEAKMDSKKNVPFQRNQMQKIVEILGTPTTQAWPSLGKYPEFQNLTQLKTFSSNLTAWFQSIGGTNKRGLALLAALLEYDPVKRVPAFDALLHPYFLEGTRVSMDIFEGTGLRYPSRRIQSDDSDITAVGGGAAQGNNNNKRGFGIIEETGRKKQK